MCTSTSAIRDSLLLDSRFLLSAVFGLCLDDVGIGARAVAVVGAHPVIIERIRSQGGNILTSYIPNVQILVDTYVSDKGIAGGDVQSVTGHTAYASPVRSEAAGS